MMNILMFPVATLLATAAFAQPTAKPAPVAIRTAPPAVPVTKAPNLPVPVAAPLPVVPQRIPRHLVRHRRLTPSTVRVDIANRAALLKPRASGYSNAVQIYPWSEGALYRLFAAPERVSDITLQAGEALVSVAAGDTVRWIVGDTSSGAGADKRIHILIKPSAAGLKTNLVIATDRRTYHLQLESTAATAMAAISWNYPESSLLALRGNRDGIAEPVSVSTGLSVQNLRFGYTISGDSPACRPIRAFDDGRQTFIAFPASLTVGEAPAVHSRAQG